MEWSFFSIYILLVSFGNKGKKTASNLDDSSDKYEFFIVFGLVCVSGIEKLVNRWYFRFFGVGCTF